MKYQMLGGQCSLRNGNGNGNGQVGGGRRTKRSCGRRHGEGQVGGQCGLRNGIKKMSGGRSTKRTLRSKRTSKTKRITRRSRRNSRRNSRNSRKTKRGNGHAHPHNPNLKGGYAITIDEVKEK